MGRLLVPQISSHGKEHEQDSKDDPNVNAHQSSSAAAPPRIAFDGSNDLIRHPVPSHLITQFLTLCSHLLAKLLACLPGDAEEVARGRAIMANVLNEILLYSFVAAFATGIVVLGAATLVN